MKISGNKQIKWASVILIIFAAVFLVLSIIGLIVGSDSMPVTFYILALAVSLLSITSGLLAFKFKEDITKGLILNVLGALCGILFILTIVIGIDDEGTGYMGAIGVFLSALYMGGINRNIRYLKKQIKTE